MFRVIWTPSAEQDLADVWLAAADREIIVVASDALDQLIAENPFVVGESRESTVSRVATMLPLGLQFDIVADDMKVFVRKVWLVRHSTRP
jgi:hypothetical protein